MSKQVRRASFPAHFFLAILVLAVATPTVLVSGYVLMRYAEVERNRLEEQLRDEARIRLAITNEPARCNAR